MSTPAEPSRALAPHDGTEPARPGAVSIGTALAAAVVLGLAALTGHWTVPLAVGALGVLLSLGWPSLVETPSPRAMSVILGGTAVGGTVTAALTRGEPYLRWVPAVVAVGVVAAFLHQLLRRGDRTRLTSALAGTVGALALVASGIAMVPVPQLRLGPDHLAVAMTGLALATLVEQVTRPSAARGWMAPLVTVSGAVGAAAFATVHGGVRVLTAVGVGVVSAYLAHSVRRVFSALPTSGRLSAQLALGSGSVLVVGVLAFVVARLSA